MLKHIPNALTLLRLVLAPVVAWLYWVVADNSRLIDVVGDDFTEFLTQRLEAQTTYSALAAILFIVAALTDLFDGMAARTFNAHSKFGRIIDPIADKALVGLPLIAIVLGAWATPFETFPLILVITFATAIIIVRDVLMTLVRLSAPDGEGARVSSLAKIKTALELFVVGAFLVGAAIKPHLTYPKTDDEFVATIHAIGVLQLIWIALLVVTAALSAYTAWRYLTPTKKPNA